MSTKLEEWYAEKQKKNDTDTEVETKEEKEDVGKEEENNGDIKEEIISLLKQVIEKIEGL